MRYIKVVLRPEHGGQELTIQRFEQIFEIHYLEHLLFDHWKVEEWIKHRCEIAQARGRMGQLALWLGKLHGSQMDRAEIPDITIRWIGETIGYGVFTNKALQQWEFIGEYTGLLRQRRIFFRDINDYCFMYPRAWISTKSFTIDSAQHGNYTRYINHSDHPNCESIAVFHHGIFHIVFRTITEIAAGTELTYDYGDIYWNRRKKPQQQLIETLISREDLKKLNI